MGLAPRGENKTCCGRTVKGASCKNRLKLRVTEKGHQKLMSLAGRPLDLTTLEFALCDIVKDFLCGRWHRSQQADDIAHRWYQAAVRKTTQAELNFHHLQPPVGRTSMFLGSSDAQMSEPDHTHRPFLDDASLNSFAYLPAVTEVLPSTGPFVSAATLRADNVPWHITPEQPAFLSCVTNIWAGVRNEGALEAFIRPCGGVPTNIGACTNNVTADASRPATYKSQLSNELVQ
ncbi:hypothetical protein N7478_001371 [Penicillium angulare]|uniref:uncharacterized protein n=1 Tax=Penicillium angulare TaxID=116970 RepID=UPI00253F9BD7|nr:uncharacterized protein N7478_001371 [Penicillium angulare]KAJ5292120.1 hypothetical protein N7478_001371 [Penicillium angulare]